ncbi:MAG: glycosyltransferase [Bacteroidaceae bacterium]|nr:glycosyltransferase [Bacteroidaceae bacterium]
MNKVLWLIANYNVQKDSVVKGNYNGEGWVSSLLQIVQSSNVVDLGVAYITHSIQEKESVRDGAFYFPIYEKPKTSLQKLRKYYGGYKRKAINDLNVQLLSVINKFQPDVIHLFGLENPMATILGRGCVPVVVHMQGLLGPIDNAFFPQGFNNSSFLWPITKREWLIRNGYIFAQKDIHVRGEREKELFANMKYCMGRTEWDKQVSRLMAPNSIYFHVDEVLRTTFYENAGKWKKLQKSTFIITSTISETIYKGLDVILKTAHLLKNETNLNFLWQVVGINDSSDFVRFFEKKSGIRSADVHLNYLGVQDERSLCQILLSSNVYVHPSYIDNSSNSVCEAQMLGVPVIGTYVGGIPSLIRHMESGILVPANAPFELAEWIKQLSENEDICNSLSKNGFQAATIRHDKKKILNDLISAYKSTIFINSHA